MAAGVAQIDEHRTAGPKKNLIQPKRWLRVRAVGATGAKTRSRLLLQRPQVTSLGTLIPRHSEMPLNTPS